MNKQEQIEKMAQAMCDGCSDAHKIPPECKPSGDCVIFHSAENAIEAGYINGADFVRFVRDIFPQQDAWGNDYIYVDRFEEALQEYLKGE